MQRTTLYSTIAALALVGAVSSAQAQEPPPEDENHVIIGVGFIDQYSPFDSAPAQTNLLPFVSIKQGPFYFEGFESGIHLKAGSDGPTVSFDAFVAARSPGGRDRQKLTVDGGVRVSLDTGFGTLSGDFRHDLTGKFAGSQLSARYSHTFTAGKFAFTPAVQATWMDRKTANYMYGITAEQRARMIRKGRSVVLPVSQINSDAINLGADLTVGWQFGKHLALFATGGGTLLHKAIYGSPAIEQRWEAQSAMGLTYRF